MTKQIISILTLLWTTSCFCQSPETLESYSDSIKSKNGDLFIVYLTRVKSQEHEGHIVRIIFSHDLKNGGALIDSYNIDKDPITGCEPEIKDYNGDGNMDYSFVSNIAARGANEVRTLFIFDPTEKRFVHIKNSEQFPNIIYNPKLKCLDSWAFHGGTSQYFLRLQSDSLVPFYAVDVYGTQRVSRKYENGNWIKIKTDSIKDEGFPRYINIDPFEEYEN